MVLWMVLLASTLGILASAGGCTMKASDQERQPYAYLVSYSPDGRWLLSMEYLPKIGVCLLLRDPASQEIQKQLVLVPPHGQREYWYVASYIRFVDQGKRIALFGGRMERSPHPNAPTPQYGCVWLLPFPELGQPTELRTREERCDSAGDVSPDGRYIAVGGDSVAENSRSIIVLDRQKGDNPWLTTFYAHQARVVSDVRFSPDGKLLATAGGDDKVQLWDVAKGFDAAGELVGHKYLVCRIAFSPDGQLIASVSWDGTARLWNVKDRREVRSLRLKNRSHREDLAVAFSPDGKVLATADQHEAVLWEVATGRRLRVLPTKGLGPIDVAFSPDGRYVAVACRGEVVIPAAQKNLEEFLEFEEKMGSGGVEQFEVETGQPRSLTSSK
jgi:WD40 repeat protein